MSINDVSVHLDMLCRNDSGTVFGNIEERVLVLRWQCLADTPAAVAVVDMLAAELAGSGADTLIYDTRRVAGEEGSALDLMLRVSAIEHGEVRRVGWLVTGEDFVLPQEVVELQDELGIDSCVGTTFEDVARALVGMPDCEGNLLSEGIANFTATYGGSCYSVPELRTTVLRTAGNFYDLPLAGEMYDASFKLHVRTKAIAFIVDSTAVAPVSDMDRYSFAIERLVYPLTRPGMVQQLVHVRAGDVLIPGMGGVQELSAALHTIEISEAETMQEALDIIRVTQGRKPLTPPAAKVAATTGR